jgi:hypothetical protein
VLCSPKLDCTEGNKEPIGHPKATQEAETVTLIYLIQEVKMLMMTSFVFFFFQNEFS